MSKSYSSTFVKKFIKHYLKYDKDNPFIFISALLALIGIAIGIMVLMIGIGVTNGTHKEFEKRLFVMNYPLTITSYDTKGVDSKLLKKIKKQFPNLKISPYYITQVISKNADSVQGAILYGVDFKKEATINPIFKKAYRDINSSKYSKYSTIVGGEIAETLGLKAQEKITLFFSKQQALGLGTMPLQRAFNVLHTFKSGLVSYDKSIIYTTHQAFEKILKKEPYVYDGVHIYTKNPMKYIDKIKTLLPKNIGIEGWWQQNGSLFKAMQMEKKALFLVLMLIILVASLNIISSLLMTVMSRRSEIALMRTLGATSKEIALIFFYLGSAIGAIGMIVGVILGYLAIWMLTTFNIISLPADIYATSKLPIDLPLSDLTTILAGTTIIILIFSFYPAIRASKTDPLKVLRNE